MLWKLKHCNKKIYVKVTNSSGISWILKNEFDDVLEDYLKWIALNLIGKAHKSVICRPNRFGEEDNDVKKL